MKIKFQILFLLILLFSSCRLLYPDIKYEPIKFGQYYFPTFEKSEFVEPQSDTSNLKYLEFILPQQPNDSLNESTNQWYSKHLSSLGEPIIYNKRGENVEIIRFTHLGTWSNPYSYRIEKRGSKIIATYNRTKGYGGYKAGRRTIHKQKVIQIEKWNEIVSKLESIDFWNYQTHDQYLILDGAEWILEVSINNKYHFVIRTSPNDSYNKEYMELCKLIQTIFDK